MGNLRLRIYCWLKINQRHAVMYHNVLKTHFGEHYLFITDFTQAQRRMPVADKFYFVSTFRVIGKTVSRNSDIVQTRGQDYKGNSNNVFVQYICLILEFIVLSRDLWYLLWNKISLSQILRGRRKMRLLTNFIFPFP